MWGSKQSNSVSLFSRHIGAISCLSMSVICVFPFSVASNHCLIENSVIILVIFVTALFYSDVLHVRVACHGSRGPLHLSHKDQENNRLKQFFNIFQIFLFNKISIGTDIATPVSFFEKKYCNFWFPFSA